MRDEKFLEEKSVQQADFDKALARYLQEKIRSIRIVPRAERRREPLNGSSAADIDSFDRGITIRRES